MIIRVFGGLKDYFEPVFELNKNVSSVSELREELCSLRPTASQLLEKCRFAVGNTIVDERALLLNSQEIAVMPPSSGG